MTLPLSDRRALRSTERDIVTDSELCATRSMQQVASNLLLHAQRRAEYCDRRVCLSVRISQKPHVHTSTNVLHALSVAVARSSSDDRAIRYVLPVLRMTSHNAAYGRQTGTTERAGTYNESQIIVNVGYASHTMAADCPPGEKSAVYDCFVSTCLHSQSQWFRFWSTL